MWLIIIADGAWGRSSNNSLAQMASIDETVVSQPQEQMSVGGGGGIKTFRGLAARPTLADCGCGACCGT